MALRQRVERARNRRAFEFPPEVPGFETRVLDTPGGRVRCVVAGAADGPTIVFSMDPPMSLEHEAPTLGLLARAHRVVAFEAPGFSFSKASPTFSFSLESFAAVFEHVMDATDTPSAILWSPCFNNLPALQFALGHPGRVRGFVGLQAPSWPDAKRWAKRMDPAGFLMTPVLGQLLTWAFSRPLQEAWLRIAEPAVEARARYVATARALHDRGALYCLASGVQATRRADPFEGKQIDCPAALLWGAKDASHRPTAPDSFARYLTRPKLLVAPNAGHFPELTAPDLLLEAVAHVALAGA
jgi:pimeloyl-ACP methyl ester carboxylesterase